MLGLRLIGEEVQSGVQRTGGPVLISGGPSEAVPEVIRVPNVTEKILPEIMIDRRGAFPWQRGPYES
jgi:hypothetical protein